MELALSARLGQALDLVAGVHAEADGEVAVRGIESETRQRLRRRTDLVEDSSGAGAVPTVFRDKATGSTGQRRMR